MSKQKHTPNREAVILTEPSPEMIAVGARILEDTYDALPALAEVTAARVFEAMADFQRAPSKVFVGFLQDQIETLKKQLEEATNPIPLLLCCPICGARHIDEGEFATTKHHHTHACQSCGFVWRPAVVNTVGVAFLPGFKNP